MASEQILATYENGVFRLVAPESLGLSEGQHVILQIEPIDRVTYILTLADRVFEGLSEEEVEEIVKHMRRRPIFSDEVISEESEEEQAQD